MGLKRVVKLVSLGPEQENVFIDSLLWVLFVLRAIGFFARLHSTIAVLTSSLQVNCL